MARALDVRDVEDIGFQEKEWTVERVFWVVTAVFLVAALVGLFGIGPVSETTATSPDDTVTVEYDRFIRHVGTTTMTIAVDDSTVQDGKVTLSISRELADGWRIENISPAPSTESSSRQALIYEFDVLGDTAPVIEVLYRGGGVGLRDGVIRAGQADGVDLWQLTYP
jgi:hypothetical protein